MPSSFSESLELILDRYAEARVGEAFGSQRIHLTCRIGAITSVQTLDTNASFSRYYSFCREFRKLPDLDSNQD
jgi:hypothetical protein